VLTRRERGHAMQVETGKGKGVGAKGKAIAKRRGEGTGETQGRRWGRNIVRERGDTLTRDED